MYAINFIIYLSHNQLHWSVTGELSQWLCHDDSTIKIVVIIIIIIFFCIFFLFAVN